MIRPPSSFLCFLRFVLLRTPSCLEHRWIHGSRNNEESLCRASVNSPIILRQAPIPHQSNPAASHRENKKPVNMYPSRTTTRHVTTYPHISPLSENDVEGAASLRIVATHVKCSTTSSAASKVLYLFGARIVRIQGTAWNYSARVLLLVRTSLTQMKVAVPTMRTCLPGPGFGRTPMASDWLIKVVS